MTDQSHSSTAEPQSASNVNQKILNDGQSGIEKIRDVFPDLDEQIVQNMLNASGHDIGIAIDTLLNTDDI